MKAYFLTLSVSGMEADDKTHYFLNYLFLMRMEGV